MAGRPEKNQPYTVAESDPSLSDEFLKAMNSMADSLHYCLDLGSVARCGVKSLMDYSQSPLAAIFTFNKLTGHLE
ncbi:MAG: hypothetical protein SWE60_26405, partial [Thermodesulfobacteriota bacterium]|nr:hypothetical protein [Thermodesulfobacteriota bacterium]